MDTHPAMLPWPCLSTATEDLRKLLLIAEDGQAWGETFEGLFNMAMLCCHCIPSPSSNPTSLSVATLAANQEQHLVKLRHSCEDGTAKGRKQLRPLTVSREGMVVQLPSHRMSCCASRLTTYTASRSPPNSLPLAKPFAVESCRVGLGRFHAIIA